MTIEVPNNKKEGNLGSIFKSSMTPAIENMSDMIIKIDKVLGKDGKKPTETKTMKIGKARPLLEELEMDKLLNADNITKEATLHLVLRLRGMISSFITKGDTLARKYLMLSDEDRKRAL